MKIKCSFWKNVVFFSETMKTRILSTSPDRDMPGSQWMTTSEDVCDEPAQTESIVVQSNTQLASLFGDNGTANCANVINLETEKNMFLKPVKAWLLGTVLLITSASLRKKDSSHTENNFNN